MKWEKDSAFAVKKYMKTGNDTFECDNEIMLNIHFGIENNILNTINVWIKNTEMENKKINK